MKAPIDNPIAAIRTPILRIRFLPILSANIPAGTAQITRMTVNIPMNTSAEDSDKPKVFLAKRTKNG